MEHRPPDCLWIDHPHFPIFWRRKLIDIESDLPKATQQLEPDLVPELRPVAPRPIFFLPLSLPFLVLSLLWDLEQRDDGGRASVL